MIVLVDNYDSFSHNLYQAIGCIDPDIEVVRNDDLPASELIAERPQAIVLSPGPGRPEDAGICEEVAATAGDIPVLGVCLGHQAICRALGARIIYAAELMHGKCSSVELDGASPLFAAVPPVIEAGRYHSLAVDEASLPSSLRVVARTTSNGRREVMAVQHERRPLFGLQFHPESILTPDGGRIIENFLNYARKVHMP